MAAVELGLVRGGGEEQLTDELVGGVVERVDADADARLVQHPAVRIVDLP